MGASENHRSRRLRKKSPNCESARFLFGARDRLPLYSTDANVYLCCSYISVCHADAIVVNERCAAFCCCARTCSRQVDGLEHHDGSVDCGRTRQQTSTCAHAGSILVVNVFRAGFWWRLWLCLASSSSCCSPCTTSSGGDHDDTKQPTNRRQFVCEPSFAARTTTQAATQARRTTQKACRLAERTLCPECSRTHARRVALDPLTIRLFDGRRSRPRSRLRHCASRRSAQ